MSYMSLPEPDWSALVGGSEAEAKWVADRDRKFGLILENAAKFLPLSEELAKRGLLFEATAEVLQQEPLAVDWYLSACGYALNTLQYIRERPSNLGLAPRILTVRRRLLRGDPVPDHELQAMSRWLNLELGELYRGEARTIDTARAVAFGLLGARSLGQGQNLGGNEGVELLKKLLVKEMAVRGIRTSLEVDGAFLPLSKEHRISESPRLRFGSRILCDFSGGGGHADIKVTDRKVIVALGEIKSRKDLSNIWESWMPQIVDHMRTWAGDSPDSVRLFFGTLITEEMVNGLSVGGGKRAGLQTLFRNGLLTCAYNISKIAASDTAASKDFLVFVGELAARAE